MEAEFHEKRTECSRGTDAQTKNELPPKPLHLLRITVTLDHCISVTGCHVGATHTFPQSIMHHMRLIILLP